ncbi:TonB-dependent siderophore receptor [Breoghania sp. L-A4]|nr:TonB-dependent siderophore receptor [Breoghania sp. L-A4]
MAVEGAAVPQAAAQNAVTLDTIVVSGGAESAVGPDETIVAVRTASGSKTDTPIVDLSASVSVITEEDLARRNVKTLDQALGYTSGVTTDLYGSDDRYDFYQIRGFYQSGNGSYRDGLPMRVQGYTGARLEPYGMQRIEVLKGSTSTLYGLNAPGGLVNSITKRPTEEKFGEVYTTAGDGHVEAGTDFGGPIDDAGVWSYRFTAKAQDGDNVADHTQDDRIYVAPALTWSPTDATSLTILADYYKRDGNASHGIPLGSGIDPNTFLGEPDFDKTNTVEKNIGWLFSHDFGSGLQFRQTARYTDLEMALESVYGANVNPAVDRSAYSVDGDAQRFGIDNQLEFDRRFNRFRSRTLVGLDYTHTATDEVRRYGTASGIDVYNPVYCGTGCITLGAPSGWSGEQNATGVYLQEELTLDERWILTLGGRYDHVEAADSTYGDSQENAFTKRAGLTFKATDEVSLYANYSESFEPVSGYTASILSRAPEPQTGTQYEAGIKYRPEGMNALFTLAAFDLTQDNVSYLVSPGVYDQLGQVRVRGIELEAKMALSERLNLNAAYTYLNAEIAKDSSNAGNRPYLTPEHSASLWMDYTIPGQGTFGDLMFGAGVRYIGSRFADNGNTYKLDATTVVDAMVNYRVTEDVSLAVNATNLFDEQYVNYYSSFDNTAFYGDRRTVMATLKYTW